MPVKPVNLTATTATVKEVNLKAMTMDELRVLRSNISDEIDKRKKEEYDKAVEDFRKALYKLYSEFGDECCIIKHYQGDYVTWEDLYNNHDWIF